MKLIPTLSDTFKGILLIISGTILLINTLGFTTQLLHSIILFGSIAMIVIGFFMANFHRKVLVLITKNEKPKGPDF
jgi:membrane-bound ClpP family serine protease